MAQRSGEFLLDLLGLSYLLERSVGSAGRSDGRVVQKDWKAVSSRVGLQGVIETVVKECEGR